MYIIYHMYTHFQCPHDISMKSFVENVSVFPLVLHIVKLSSDGLAGDGSRYSKCIHKIYWHGIEWEPCYRVGGQLEVSPVHSPSTLCPLPINPPYSKTKLMLGMCEWYSSTRRHPTVCAMRLAFGTGGMWGGGGGREGRGPCTNM